MTDADASGRPRRRAAGLVLLAALAWLAAHGVAPAQDADWAEAASARPGAWRTPTPDLFVLGDSQITFGAGEPLVELFEDLGTRCAPHWRRADQLARRFQGSVGVIGVRSTSIHSWTQRTGPAKDMICEKDQRWGVNAGAYGFSRTHGDRFEQVGEHAHNAFCRPHDTAFEAMFERGYYAPKLFVMYFLGNSQSRWIQDPSTARDDARRLARQLPPGMPCVFMATAPSYKPDVNDRRAAAQRVILGALRQNGRCAVVEGITSATRGQMEGQASFFYRREDGSVRDPFHPNQDGARRFLTITTPALCRAVEAAPRLAQSAPAPRDATQ